MSPSFRERYMPLSMTLWSTWKLAIFLSSISILLSKWLALPIRDTIVSDIPINNDSLAGKNPSRTNTVFFI